jgi:Sigma-70 region 2
VEALLAQCEWVRQLVRHLVFDRDVADDVVQQTYLAALEHPPARLESPRGWLAQVARRFAFQVEMVEAVPVSGTIRLADGSPVAHATVIFAPASVAPEDFHAIEDMIGRGPLDWSRFATEDGVREMSGVRVRTDAAGAFSTNVNSSRPLALRRVERWRAGEPEPIEGFEPIEAGTVLVPGGPAKVIVVQRSPKPSSSRR